MKFWLKWGRFDNYYKFFVSISKLFLDNPNFTLKMCSLSPSLAKFYLIIFSFVIERFGKNCLPAVSKNLFCCKISIIKIFFLSINNFRTSTTSRYYFFLKGTFILILCWTSFRFQLFHLHMNMLKQISWSVHLAIHSTIN